MKFEIRNEPREAGADAMANMIAEKLNAGAKVLWLVCGGSNIPISVQMLEILKKSDAGAKLKNLTVMLTDERYGSINHPDSNWRQLKEKGFDFTAVMSIPVLTGKSLDETTKMFGVNIRDSFNANDFKIGQFGIGFDGHIAGVLPRTIGVASPGTVISYDAGTFKRLTVTLNTIEKLDAAFSFAYGESKQEALANLEVDMTTEKQPAQIIKKLNESYLYRN